MSGAHAERQVPGSVQGVVVQASSAVAVPATWLLALETRKRTVIAGS